MLSHVMLHDMNVRAAINKFGISYAPLASRRTTEQT